MKTLRFILLSLATVLFLVAAKPSMQAAALHFDGVDDYVSIPNGAVNLANSSMTVEFWARRTAPGSPFDAVLTSGSTVAQNQHLHIGFRNNNVLTFAFWANDIDTPVTYTDDAWHHFACTYNSADRSRRIYADGVLVASDTALANFQGNSASMFIGLDAAGPSYFHGDLDEFRIWNTARTQAEVQANRSRRLLGTETGLLAYLRLDEGFGTTAGDSSGRGVLGTLVNGPTWNTTFDATQVPLAANLPASSVGNTTATLNALVNTNGLFGTNRFQYGPGSMALGLDGQNDEVVVTHTAALNAYPLTVSTWVRANGEKVALLTSTFRGR